MKIYQLNKSQWVNKPIHEVFDFFKNPSNLGKITPESLGFRILTPDPIEMEKGRLIDYTICLLGIPQRWTTLITDYKAPYQFVDEQLKGPYDFWHHTHRFIERDEGTQIIDEVRYVMPMGLMGEWAHHLFVKNKLQGIFNFRAQVIERYFQNES